MIGLSQQAMLNVFGNALKQYQATFETSLQATTHGEEPSLETSVSNLIDGQGTTSVTEWAIHTQLIQALLATMLSNNETLETDIRNLLLPS